MSAFCPQCASRQLKAVFASNDNDFRPDSIFLHCDCVIRTTAYTAATGKALVALEMSRRQIPEWTWAVIAKFDHDGGRAFYHCGAAFDLANLPDDPFPEDDGSSIRDLLGYAVREPSRIRAETAARVRVLTVALAICRPDLIVRFGL